MSRRRDREKLRDRLQEAWAVTRGEAERAGSSLDGWDLCDVVLEETHRSRGVGTWVMERILDHPTIRTTRVLLITRDAQSFYGQFGFESHPFECMVKPEASA